MITRELKPKKPTMNQTSVFDTDLIEIVTLRHSANAQDSPYPKHYYLDQILNRAFAYLSPDQRKEVDQFLADKKYLAPVEIILETT